MRQKRVLPTFWDGISAGRCGFGPDLPHQANGFETPDWKSPYRREHLSKAILNSKSVSDFLPATAQHLPLITKAGPHDAERCTPQTRLWLNEEARKFDDDLQAILNRW